MKRIKKFLFLLLSAFIIFSIMPLSVFAEEEQQVSPVLASQKSQALYDLVLENATDEEKVAIDLYLYNVFDNDVDRITFLYKYGKVPKEEKADYCKNLIVQYYDTLQKKYNKEVLPVVTQRIKEDGAYIFYNIKILKTQQNTYNVSFDITQNIIYEMGKVSIFLPCDKPIAEKSYDSLFAGKTKTLSLVEENEEYLHLVSEFEVDDLSQISAFLGIPEVLNIYPVIDKETGKENFVVYMNADLSEFDENQKNFLQESVLNITLESPDKIVSSVAPIENFSSSERNVYSWIITPEINNTMVFRFDEKNNFQKYFHIYVLGAMIFYCVAFFISKKYIDYKKL